MATSTGLSELQRFSTPVSALPPLFFGQPSISSGNFFGYANQIRLMPMLRRILYILTNYTYFDSLSNAFLAYALTT